MSKEDNGGTVFPTPKNPMGMSLRDYFAAKAMPACYAEMCRDCTNTGFPEGWKMGVALDAYMMADAMLEARNK